MVKGYKLKRKRERRRGSVVLGKFQVKKVPRPNQVRDGSKGRRFYGKNFGTIGHLYFTFGVFIQTI